MFINGYGVFGCATKVIDSLPLTVVTFYFWHEAELCLVNTHGVLSGCVQGTIKEPPQLFQIGALIYKPKLLYLLPNIPHMDVW